MILIIDLHKVGQLSLRHSKGKADYVVCDFISGFFVKTPKSFL